MGKTIHHAVNVEVIDEAFEMPQLQRTRRIWVYKPAGYYRTNKKYPVLYMHDGQNLFDESTAFGEEWGIDETLNSLQAECLVIGIDNSENRMTEYNFHDHEEFGPGEGRKYIEFVINTLKPVIDLNFRTRRNRSDTYIAGSSMGGLISLYGAMYFPATFGGAGVFSPALWPVPDFIEELQALAVINKKFRQRFYFYAGAKEGDNMVEHIASTAGMMRKYKRYSVTVEIDDQGEHHEYYWRKQFGDFYTWLAAGRKAKVKRCPQISQVSNVHPNYE